MRLRPLGSPVALGVVALGVASLVTSGLDLGWVPPDETGSVGVMLLAFAFPLQIVASWLSFAARDGVAASVLGVQACTWLATGVMYVVSPPRAASDALGLLLVAAGIAVAGSAGAMAFSKVVPAALFGLAGLRFVADGIHQLGGWSAWQDAAGAVGLAVTLGAAYCALALQLEDTLGHDPLPLLRRGRGRLALEGRAAEQLEGIENEPGVRKLL